jgi:phage I-like protein
VKTPNIILLNCSAPNKGERVLAVAKPHALPILAKDDDPLPKELCWMPSGATSIVASRANGEAWDGTVVCDEIGCNRVMADFAAARTGNVRVWLDESHKNEAAVADITAMRWDPALGIMAEVKWTAFGARLLRERQYTSFSPSFYVDLESGRVSGVVTGHASGGLTNSPAFGAAMPALIAARMAGSKPNAESAGALPGTNNTTADPMKEKLLKILASMGVTPPADATDEKLLELVTEHAAKRDSASELTALKAALAELKAKADKPETAAAVADLKKVVDALQAAAVQARKDKVASAVQAAIDRGAIAKDDKTTIEFWTKIAEANDEALAQLNAMKGAKAPEGEVTIPTEAQIAASRAQIEITDVKLVEALKAYAKQDSRSSEGRRMRAKIYASHIGRVFKGADSRFALGPILASNTLGSLAGDLIVQRALTLLKYAFPALTAFSTDFSDASVKFNQDIVSRIRTVPTSANFVPGSGYATNNITTTDVPVKIDQHKGVEISFDANELASTDRDLFGEQVEGAHQRIGLDITDTLYALITVANFANESVCAANSFNRAAIAELAGELYSRGVSGMNQALLLNNEYFGQLQSDAAIVALGSYQRPELITEYMLPRMAGMQPYHAITLDDDPATEGQDLVGFGGTPDSLLVATRVPNDYAAALPGASNGAVSVVTNPDTGISVQLVQYVDHNLAAAYWRVAYMWGVAVGQANSGQRLVRTATSS